MLVEVKKFPRILKMSSVSLTIIVCFPILTIYTVDEIKTVFDDK